MGSILFEHNRKAYVAAVEMMARTGRSAIIHPTGTGKSFIALQLCADNPKSRVCLLSPSEYIFATQMEKWVLAGGEVLKNIQFITYARLMRMGEDELSKIAPDYIVLDEFHRCGAAQWGGGVERLRGMYPEAKMLGLSATNIRYLDNQRDMAWELFGGNVASELTLGAAVACGILPAPKYVLSVYAYQKELQRYEMRVRQARNKAVRDKAEKELEALRRALEKADGLDEIFARHMLPETGKRTGGAESADAAMHGKYIVFCANYGHLLEMRELALEWFRGVDASPHIYTAYSDDPAASEEFKAFKADTSGHLKLLYCIDMLNEGIHVDDVDGVILLRPTVSPTIYKQQIGRALASGEKKVPVIFDIVMNIENLYSIGGVEEELRKAVFACRAGGRGDEIVNEHFRVIDELGDCRRLFAQLNETLGASWDAMYAMAREYYETHGNLEVPKRYATPEGYSLGAWLDTQRKVYAGKVAGNLSREQIRKLSAIGMRWQGVWEAAWERHYAEAVRYYQEHGDLNVPAAYVTADGCRLGRWVRGQRDAYRNAARWQEGRKKNPPRFDPQRKSRLDEIGMVWENGDPWEEKFALAKKYYEEHGNLDMAADYVVEGVWLEKWLREQKIRLAAWEKALENEKTVEQEGAKFAAQENTSPTAARRFAVQRNGEPSDGMEISGSQAAEPKDIKPLHPDQAKKLCSIGITPGMTKTERSWRQQYGEAEAFFREHGNLVIPKRYTAGNGKKLGVWLQHQRINHRSGQLSGWQVMMLDGIGMVWEFDDPWENGFRHAEEYFRENSNLAVPNQYVCMDGYRLGKWISNQRCSYGSSGTVNKRLTKEQVRRLEAIGMVWSAKAGRRSGKNETAICKGIEIRNKSECL